uniref:Reverse transcriptase Ty1/copia-type domain-containing protein n=1 Tax=Amphimedon queenslandica TaxID=400682 RepID=A0A1X7TTU7_AMPQE
MPYFMTVVTELLMMQIILELVTGHSRSDGLLGNFCDSKSFNMQALFSSEPHALQLMIYYDDLKLCNPFGTKTNVHKMELINFLPLRKCLLFSSMVLILLLKSLWKIWKF